MKKLIIAGIAIILVAIGILCLSIFRNDLVSNPKQEAITETEADNDAIALLSEEDYEFHGLELDRPIPDTIPDIFGKPVRINEYPSEIGEIIEKEYTYPGFVIKTYIYQGKEKLSEIRISGKDIETQRGIRVGDTEERVVEKYGPEQKLYESYCYQIRPNSDRFEDNIPPFGEYALQFDIKDGRVSHIMYYIAPD